MIKLLLSIGLLCYLFNLCHCGSLSSEQQVEQTLITSLLNGYNKNIRPIGQVIVIISASIQQIVAIDEKQQIMTSSSFINQAWYDGRLSWTPNATNNNITVVMLPVKSLWIPDTMIVNSADASGYLTVNDYSLVSVYYLGIVAMVLPALTVKTRCSILVQKFPFDSQMCPINLTSWGQGDNRLHYIENSSLVIDLSGYTEHPIWALNRTDMIITKTEDRVPFEATFNDIISIQLYLQRKPLYFILNGIFACFILNCVTLLSYALAFTTQIGLCMTCFMTYSVYSLTFSSLFPQQSDYIMMITLYFLLSVFWTLISMAWFVLCNYWITKDEMPKLIYNFCGHLQRVLFCCFTPTKKNDKTNKKNDDILENGPVKKSEDEQGTTAPGTQTMKCISCQKLFTSCFSRCTRVEVINEKQHTVGPSTETLNANTTESAVGVMINETNETAKHKCNFCERCESCQADFNKDKEKNKKKKDIESRCGALNYLIFALILLFMFISNMALWFSMSK